MRILLFLFIMALTAAGPAYYLTIGARARDERREHLTVTSRAAAGVRSLLARHTPPTNPLLEAGAERLQRRRAVLDQFADEVTAALETPLLAEPVLQKLARDFGVADVVLAPTFATLAGEPLELERRRALQTILFAVRDTGEVVLEELRVAKNEENPGRSLPVRLLRVTVSALGDATALCALSERLAGGSAKDPPGDLVEARMSRPSEGDWYRLGWSKIAPPLRLHLVIDLVIGRSSSP